ncbi:putative pentatricopeptide repeat-containing protein At3g01580 isoform X1 [Selaginella moellendorffii]|uniref:putative pentatricopeptide repeat-containing protein At3g01580 isoform X1 n=2 Tax=Selaginella moellendorffii TaxID=88036 RepID=UPI000D1D03CA|nr:putative pentatricopeptide repeat-containing protein At3g01580 isoform X1 [Selaginella moellendorffii]XP_024541673.1 putative pentatricopeptide repeat-containing protein At3g01580 isoform X1 [Selaginella moellendorffii]|eukprot:XP_024541672.1 putative pentatricopeptide repeat-containing protein At3g01580 isoform X1 [Selaginella moellendorffii]
MRRSRLARILSAAYKQQARPQIDQCWQKHNAALLPAIKACGSARDLDSAKIIHSKAHCLHPSDIFVASSLVSMYSRCQSMADARTVFNQMPRHDTVLWNSLMLGFVETGRYSELVLESFAQMQHQGCHPDARSFLAAIRACTALAIQDSPGNKLRSLERGKKIHFQAESSGCGDNVFVINSLVEFYAKCGSMDDAWRAFQRMPYELSVCWSSLILGYAESGDEELALEIFSGMSLAPESRTMVAALKACMGLAAKEDGSKVGVDARVVKTKALQRGVALHSQAVSCGLEKDVYVASTLVSMYSKCGSMIDAYRVFCRMDQHDAVSWTALMLGYVENSEPELALEVFSRMQKQGSCRPDATVYLVALKACGSLAEEQEEKEEPTGGRKVRVESLERGMEIHAQAARNGGFNSDVFVASTLVDVYSKCGSLVDARRVFDTMPCYNVVAWNSLLMGYAENDEAELCLELFFTMRRYCQPDCLTFVAALKACSSLAENELAKEVDEEMTKKQQLKYLDKVMAVHSIVVETSGSGDTGIYVSNTLVDAYAKSGSMADSRRVFDRMRRHSVVSWTALLLGYTENKEAELALEILPLMSTQGSCLPDARTLAAVVTACTQLVDLEQGRAMHAEVLRLGFETEIVTGNCLVDLYSKSGIMERAQRVFDSMEVLTSPITWTSLIAGYTRYSDSDRVFQIFTEMQEQGLPAYDVTLICVLTACSHAGLVDEGTRFFERITCPSLDHYHCYIDILSRANRLDAAMAVVKTMPWKATAVTWRTVLGACHKWKNVEIGRLAFEKLIEVDGGDFAGYTLMGNIYGAAGLWEEKQRVEAIKQQNAGHSVLRLVSTGA